ncbi:ABC transporter ATP-binding protein, partial [Enterococcus faecalis]|nr:ABC transporter ATP-binding protein [Enterococcus faecalis]NSP77244.1 ABC transporter ATP-binding protein [Enterococcus faecalis]
HGKVLEDKNLKKQSIKINDRNYMTVNFLNLSDLKSVIVPSAIQTNINDEELMIEMELENSQVLEAVDWVMKLVIERKIQNYKVSPKSLNETYGELIDENDKKL